ncbi:hypothetical protein NECAME_13217 [Necator americanus]|uniref:Mos1 transposase HTH domain-containing protein n=1 Tax=Necator americanus TaxID=51031 RepID=W2SYR1_NECAM|nr:hypothetical protein NECAME_13217 [Necator americanus]ETN74081.1 hypothetical protein NECAME_13217 [Necator americanus]
MEGKGAEVGLLKEAQWTTLPLVDTQHIWLPLPCLFSPIMAGHATHIRRVLFYEFESGHLTAEAHRNLSQVFGTEAPSERSVRAWFQRFEAGNKKLEDGPRSDRPTATSFDELKDLAEQHPYESVRYFAASLGCSLSTLVLVSLNRSVVDDDVEEDDEMSAIHHRRLFVSRCSAASS